MSLGGEDKSLMISFLKHIEQYPCLWDYTSKSYTTSTVVLMEAAWKKVSEELNESEETCRDRWKNIRTSFEKSLRLPRSGTWGKNRKPYYLADYLDFVRPYIKGGPPLEIVSPKESSFTTQSPAKLVSDVKTRKITQSPAKIESDVKTRKRVGKISPQINKRKISLDETLFDIRMEICPNEAPTKKRKSNSRNDDGNESSELEEYSEKETDQQDEKDSDWLFFRSVLVDFKKLNEKRKRRLKIKFVTLLNEELNQTELETSSSTSYS